MCSSLITIALGISIFLLPVSVSALSIGQDKNSKIIFLKTNKKETQKLSKLLNNVENIFKGVEKVRKLNASSKVTVGIKSPGELNQFLLNIFAKEYSDNDLKKDYLLLERLGLIKINTNLKETFLNLYTEQIAGFYDDNSKSLYLIENSKLGNLEFSIIISHELVHALQDQNYNLKRVLESNKNNDVTLARMALIEGEAMVASMQYQVDSFARDLGSIPDLSSLLKSSFFNSSGMDVLKKAPGYLVEQMTFPYIEGAKFVQYIYNNAGSWEKFSNIYNNLPNSTEQILHPEKYLNNEQPLKVYLNEKFLNDKNWTFLHKDSFGEFFIMNYFLEYLDEKTAKIAASGWGGDSFALYEKGDKDSLFVLKTLWDTEKDASEFFNAYLKSLEERYVTDLKVRTQTEKEFEADTPRGKVYVILDTNSVNLTEGFSGSMKENIVKYLSEN